MRLHAIHVDASHAYAPNCAIETLFDVAGATASVAAGLALGQATSEAIERGGGTQWTTSLFWGRRR